MKNLAFSFFLFFFVLQATAQYPKLIVQLKDRANTTYSLSNPALYLSQRAIDRRVRYSIPVDSADLPVSTAYVDSLRKAGNVTILSQSKWLNEVLIETTDQNAINRISSYSFVKFVKSVGYRVVNNNHNKSEKARNSVNTTNKTSGTKTDTYNYCSR